MKNCILILCLLFAKLLLNAQPLPLLEPELSQASNISQQLGLSVISLSYHSPSTQGRKVFGQLVPFGKPWRAGANENTVFSVTDDVLIEGSLLPAGSYGLHVIPSENEWVVIFSKNSRAWGSYFYNEKEEALRIKIVPIKTSVQNWLSYQFIEPNPNNVLLKLHWDDVAISFKVSINKLQEVVIKSMQNELTSRYGFFWQGYAQAASYCIRNKQSLELAEMWINTSISIKKNYTNLSIKAALFKTLNKLDSAALIQAEAKAVQEKELSIADENEINNAAYGYLASKDYQQAIKLFKLNILRFPDSWNVYDGLGEALMLAGEKKESIKNYKIALTKVLPKDQKERIENILKD